MRFARKASLTAGILFALYVRFPLFAQATRVPFIGCASTGMETLEAPQGTSRSVPINSKDAQSLAYYGAEGIGVLAPRGWYCAGGNGSSGYGVFVGPKPIRFDGSGWVGLEGAIIEVSHITSGASGRYEIAEIMARVFPGYRAFAAGVLEGMPFPLPAGPYPHDTLIHKSKAIVEYNTPAQTDGLGNFDSYIGKNNLPIRGVAIMIGDPPDVRDGPDIMRLSVRLPPALAGLIPVIVGEVERETLTLRLRN